ERSGMILERVIRSQPTCDRRSRRESLDAVIVERANTPRLIARASSQPDVADFRVEGSLERKTVNYEAAPDACADRDVRERADALSRTQPPLGDCRDIDVGVDRNRHAEMGRKPGAEIRARPTGLRCVEHATVIGRLPIAYQGPKGRDAD